MFDQLYGEKLLTERCNSLGIPFSRQLSHSFVCIVREPDARRVGFYHRLSWPNMDALNKSIRPFMVFSFYKCHQSCRPSSKDFWLADQLDFHDSWPDWLLIPEPLQKMKVIWDTDS